MLELENFRIMKLVLEERTIFSIGIYSNEIEINENEFRRKERFVEI